MPIRLYGPWTLEVVKAIHNWENRYVIAHADSGSGTYGGQVGEVVDVEGPAWTLNAQYKAHGTDVWRSSDMKIMSVPELVETDTIIGSEDPLPKPDFEDIQWKARFRGEGFFAIPVRPYALRPHDLMQMPDGIFEASLGAYYMAVRVENHWGLAFGPDHVLDISAQSRAELAIRNIFVLNNWSFSELESLGQRMSGTGISLEGLEPGQARTYYFKVNVSGARARKHDVTFAVFNRAGMADPANPKRFVRKQIFVSRTRIDPATHEIVSEVQEGEIRVKLREVAIDQKNAVKRRRPTVVHPGGGGSLTPAESDDLRRKLEKLLEGRKVDPCAIRDLIERYCGCDCEGGKEPPLPSDGKHDYPPFFAFPTKFDYAIVPRSPFEGQHGPLPYDDPWWKVLLLIIAVVSLIGGMLAEGAAVAYQEDENLIGKLGRFQQNDIDAALCELDTDRALAMKTVLDAQSGEDFQMPMVALDGTVPVAGTPLTRAEIAALLPLPPGDVRRKVFKSGARTGFTHGIVSALTIDGHMEATWTIPQVLIIPDPAFGEPTSRKGDSGSIWVQSATMRPVALHHTGATDGSGSFALASLLDDVQTRLSITI